MNLTPLFEWGMKMFQLLDKKQLGEKEAAVLPLLVPFPMRYFIFDTYQLLISMEKMQEMLKNNGFSRKSACDAKRMLAHLQSVNAIKIKKQINGYFQELIFKTEGNTICCSSDIIESCFGRYKEIVNGNKAVGISDLCLCIAAMTGNSDNDSIRQAMEAISMKRVKEWRKDNICKTLFMEKMELNRKIERNNIRIL